MKSKLTATALAMALSMVGLHADEPQEPVQAPIAQDTAAAPHAKAAASAPARAPVVQEGGGTSAEAAPAAKSRKPAPTRKVASDYAPAQDLLLSAMSLIGVKYKWGGSTPESGLDCSGFIRYVFQNSLNITLPHNALGMSRIGDDINRNELKPGDLVFFNTLKRKFSHVGIYLGDGRFIHSPRTGRNIEIANMSDRYWTSRFDGARRMSELDHESIDVNALLQGKQARATRAAPVAATTAPDRSESAKTCRKVTSVRKGKKITSTVCTTAKPTAKKPASKSAVKDKPSSKKKASPAPAPKKKPVIKKKR